MVAAFGSGASFSLVSGLGGPNQAANVVTSGLFFALFQGALFKDTLHKTYNETIVAGKTVDEANTLCLMNILRKARTRLERYLLAHMYEDNV